MTNNAVMCTTCLPNKSAFDKKVLVIFESIFSSENYFNKTGNVFNLTT